MFVWTPDMIRFMQAANEKSDYHARLAAILAPRLSGCRTLCDAGCGLGALSAALSPYFEKITAADVSDGALDMLRQTIRTRQLTNITPLHCDLLTSEDRTQYDAIVFCFFGSLAEILPVAHRQCAKTVIIIKKNYDLHRFSLTEQPIRGETAPAACETLRKLGVPFEFDAQELEHGQPFASDGQRAVPVLSAADQAAWHPDDQNGGSCMKALFTSMLQALAQGEGVVLCSILASSGSTPRGAGAKMAVFADGHTEGTVGGGAVELESGKLAMEVLKTKQSLVHGYCLAPNEVADIGMICGGNVTVFFQYFDPQAEADTALLRGILELLNGNQNSWLVYRMDDGCVSAMGTYDEAHGLRFTDCITPDELRPMLRADAVTKKGEPRYYVEPLTRAGYAYIFGGGHVGAALVPVLASVDFRVVVYDNRPGFATPEHYPQAERVILGDYLDIGAHLTLTENDYVCIMTPGHQADREVLLQAMRSPATYIGCIGSRHKIASTNAYLMENGIPETELARIHAPIGLDILGQTPAEIAVSIAAEMILHRAKRSGTAKKPREEG